MPKTSIIENGGKWYCNKSNRLTKEKCTFSSDSLLAVINHITVDHFASRHKATRKRSLEALNRPTAIQQREIRQAIAEAKLYGNPHKH